ncbi:hypothetical protein JCM31185_17740 [Furfurilactobacillus curtus]|uniref:Uncharacterized protein n=1 Tax=Furfurilactobacillus curtus TaxID=1746200 RepID=A0ABQ5JTT9_9LACO
MICMDAQIKCYIVQKDKGATKLVKLWRIRCRNNYNFDRKITILPRLKMGPKPDDLDPIFSDEAKLEAKFHFQFN